MDSPNPGRREQKLQGDAGSSFYRHLCIWFFYHGSTWSGTASELVSELKAGAAPASFKFESWPDTPNDVCEYLEQHTEELRAAGLDVRLNVQAGLRMIGITWSDGIRRQPPIAIDPKASATLPDGESNKSKVERLA